MPSQSRWASTVHAGRTANSGSLHFIKVVEPAPGYERPVYVDKSFALEILLGKPGIHVLISPRGSGKSTLLQMIDYCLSSGHEGRWLTNKEQRLKNLQNIPLDALTPSNTWRFEEHFAKYPVLTFTHLVDRPSIYFESIAYMMYEAWSHWLRYLTASLVDPEHLRTVDIYSQEPRPLEKVDPDVLAISLKHLIKLISIATQTQVVVLIDEYDKPLRSLDSANDEKAIEDLRAAEEFYTRFYHNAFEDRDALRFALMIGVFNVSKSSWGTDANPLQVHTLYGADTSLSTATMFLEGDVENLLKISQTGCPNLRLTIHDLQKLYKGYETWDGNVLYNPLAVAKALDRGLPGTYSFDASLLRLLEQASGTLIQPFFDLARRHSESVLVEWAEALSAKNIPRISSSPNDELDKCLCMIFIQRGYLSVQHGTVHGQAGHVKIPNLEVYKSFWAQFPRKFLNQACDHHRDESLIDDIYDAIRYGDAEDLQHGLSTLFRQFQFLNGRWAAWAHKGIVVDMLLHAMYKLKASEDCIVIERNRSQFTAVLLFRWGENLAEASSLALETLSEEARRSQVSNDTKRLLEYGVGVHGRECRVMMRDLTRMTHRRWQR